MFGVKIWLDDVRPAPHGWVQAHNYAEFTKLVKYNGYMITHISFDHDLGEDLTGYDCATFFEGQTHFDHDWPIPEMHCHSDNPAGRKRIELCIRNINKRKG